MGACDGGATAAIKEEGETISGEGESLMALKDGKIGDGRRPQWREKKEIKFMVVERKWRVDFLSNLDFKISSFRT